MAADYSKTVHLPKTAFPMKGDLPKREPGILEFWEKSGIYERMQEAAAGSLSGVSLPTTGGAAVCVVIASGGYPGNYEKGKKISFHPSLKEDENVLVFHAGTATGDQGVVTAGGRVFGVTGLGGDVPAAAAAAYRGVDRISFEGMYFRRDIAWREIKRLAGRG